MHIDGINILGLKAGILQTINHYFFGSYTFRMWSGHMVGIGRESASRQFRIYFGSSGLGMLVFFEYERTGAFS